MAALRVPGMNFKVIMLAERAEAHDRDLAVPS